MAVLAAGTSLLTSAAVAAPAERAPLNVVASFTVLADIARNVGGDDVVVESLVGPDSDSHVFEPSPSHAQSVANADLVVINGLGYEGWMGRLIDASGFDGPVVMASADAELIETGGADHHGHDDHGHDDHEEDDHGHDHEGDTGGDYNPHVWQSVSGGQSYARTIADALADADPDNAEAYRDRLAAYDSELAALDREIDDLLGSLPEEQRTVIVPHASFDYFSREYGITFLSPSGLTTEAEPTAAQMAGLVDLIHAEGVAAILAENVSSPRMVELLAEEAGLAVGGTLYSDALSGPDGPAPSYIDMLRHNASVLHDAVDQGVHSE